MEKIIIGDDKQIHVQKREFKGKWYLDVRTWIKIPNYEGYTKKGVNVPVEHGQKLAEIIAKVCSE